MKRWYMLTVVGRDRPGIVAQVTAALYRGGSNLGEASMMRLGGNFTIMLMVQHDGTLTSLREMVAPVVTSMDMHLHVDEIDGHLHEHLEPDVRISVFGADRAGIVAKVSSALSGAGLHILNLESDVGGSAEQPLYIMHIEGQAREGLEALHAALVAVEADGIETRLDSIETLVG